MSIQFFISFLIKVIKLVDVVENLLFIVLPYSLFLINIIVNIIFKGPILIKFVV